MKHQTLMSSKDKSKKIKVSSATILVWRFKVHIGSFPMYYGWFKGSRKGSALKQEVPFT